MRFKATSLVNAALIAVSMSASLAIAADPPKIATITYIGFDGAPLNLTERVAIEKGLFAAHGLDVKFIGGASGQQMVSGLLSGSAQIGTLTTSATAPLMKQGQCFQYLTSGARTYYNLIAHPDLKFPNAGKPFPDNLVDLKGKKVGINARGTALEFMVDALLKEAGMSPGDITYIATGGAATAVAALRNRQVDVLMNFPISEQLLKPDEYQYVAKLMDTEKRNPIHNLTQVFSGASCEYVKQNPAVVAAFCAAIGDAYRYVNNPANRDAVIDVVQKTMKIDQAMSASFWQQYKRAWPTAKIDAKEWTAQTMLLPKGTDLPAYKEHVPAACQAKL